MAMINLDTGIIISSLGVITTIVLFILKTYSTKATKAVVQTEMVKAHEGAISSLETKVEGIYKDIDQMKENSTSNRGRLDNLAEAITSLIRTNEAVSARINAHDNDLVGVKKDIEYLKNETIKQERDIDQNRNKIDKVHDTLYNQYNRPYSRTKTKGRETTEGYDPHENRGDYDDVGA